MWSNLIYLAPVAAIISTVHITEPAALDGDLQDELIWLFTKYISPTKLSFIRNKNLKATINTSYPEGTSLWTILDSTMQRMHLTIEIQAPTPDSLTIELMEGSAWKTRS